MKLLPRKSARGLTLLELVVVLAILAIVTSIAVASLSVVEDQTRFDTSARQIEDIEIAILGERGLRNANNQPLINGFVADIGRLPVALDLDGDSLLQPSELWSPVVSVTPPVTLEPFLLRPAIAANLTGIHDIDTPNALVPATEVEDSSVLLGTGWRGPYLRMNAGNDSLRDSWGNSLDLLSETNGPITPNDSIFGVRSRGSDYSLDPATGFARDQGFNVATATFDSTFPNDRLRGNLIVNVEGTFNNDTVTALLYVPDGSLGKLRCFRMRKNSITGSSTSFAFPKFATFNSIQLNITTVGTRVISVHKGSAAPFISGSASRTFTISSGNNTISLELP